MDRSAIQARVSSWRSRFSWGMAWNVGSTSRRMSSMSMVTDCRVIVSCRVNGFVCVGTVHACCRAAMRDRVLLLRGSTRGKLPVGRSGRSLRPAETERQDGRRQCRDAHIFSRSSAGSYPTCKIDHDRNCNSGSQSRNFLGMEWTFRPGNCTISSSSEHRFD